MRKYLIIAATVALFASQHAAAQTSEESVVAKFVQVVRDSGNLDALYPGIVPQTHSRQFSRIASCKPSNLAKRGDNLFTVDWSCSKISESGFMEFHLRDGKIISVEFFPISKVIVKQD